MNKVMNGRVRQTAGVGRLVRRLEQERRRWSWGAVELVPTEQAWRAGVVEGLRLWQVRRELEQLDRDTWGESGAPIDLDTVTVINDWRLVGVGHHNHAERELAMAIAERNRQQRTTERRRT